MFHPNKFYRAAVNRVSTPNLLDVTIDLTLGVMIQRAVVINGFSSDGLCNDKAVQCLVTMIGGKSIYIHTDAGTRDGHIRADVFTDAWNPPVPPAQIINIACCEQPVLVVSAWMRWAASIGYDAHALRMALKGKS